MNNSGHTVHHRRNKENNLTTTTRPRRPNRRDRTNRRNYCSPFRRITSVSTVAYIRSLPDIDNNLSFEQGTGKSILTSAHLEQPNATDDYHQR